MSWRGLSSYLFIVGTVLTEAASVSSSTFKDVPLIGRDFVHFSANQSALPSGWSGSPQCFAECTKEPLRRFLLGASFTDPLNMTIESCVSFCDQQGYIMAGLLGEECRCSNIYNPDTCFESDFGECDFGDPDVPLPTGGRPCPGNPAESCGNNFQFAAPPLYNIFFKNECRALWRGGAKMTSGPWRLIWFYNDTVGARALQHNAVDLHPGLQRGNMTVESCLNACNASGFPLAGVEFADECYCGTELLHNSQPLSTCRDPPPNANAMRCKGDPHNYCGGPNLLYLYSLPGTGFTPPFPFDEIFDGYCDGGCNEFGIHT